MSRELRRIALVSILAGFLAAPFPSCAQDSAVQVRLDSKRAGPRTLESLTEQGIVRDYRLAWTSMARALELNRLDPLDGPFAGEAKQWLRQTITSQHSGLSQRYLDQDHQLEAVFYAPEGDAIELHDTARYRFELLDGGKLICDRAMTVRYVVLMTPSADRWLVRQLQAVPAF
jgi:hypothetical protein